MAGGHPAPNVTADLAHTQSRRINAPAPIFVANPNSQASLAAALFRGARCAVQCLGLTWLLTRAGTHA
eukprot:2028010-Rhodomonas_salina.3